MSKPHIIKKGSRILSESWEDDRGRTHRENGLPAIITDDGYESYWNHGTLMAICNSDGVWHLYSEDE